MEEHIRSLLGQGASTSQREAWTEELRVLRTAFRDAAVARVDVLHWGLVLEYELHLEGGRRPDVVVLTGSEVLTLEFKSTDRILVADLDQTAAYARDLAEYHSESHGKEVRSILVPTGMTSPVTDIDGVEVVPPSELARVLAISNGNTEIDLEAWLHADYVPIPSLVEAARLIFRQEGLPRIRRCWSSGVPQAVALLGSIIDSCADDSARALAFLAGVPGAGKTLAGLQLVYERSELVGPAVFLSGNGPLVEVLRDALGSKTFVKDLHAFIKTYSQSLRRPETNVIVFDEAQRAWDAAYMEHKKGIQASEPDLLVEIGERVPKWATLVGLVGDGQEIHAGEEGGMRQWAEAIKNEATEPWRIYCPPRLAQEFAGLDVEADSRLDLTVTLRSRRAERLHDWVGEVLSGRLSSAARLAQVIRASAFPMYITRDLERAKAYVRQRYHGDDEARYGLIASSRTQSFLPNFGVDTSWPSTKRVKFSAWYNEPPGRPGAGGNLQDVVTEFGCQGLELDMPIVAWGDDLVWVNNAWQAKKPRGGYPLEDPEQLRLNAYRVLLTRGRDGLIIYVPETSKLDSTETALLAAGVQPLASDLALVI